MTPTKEERREVADAIRFYAHESYESAYEFLKGYWPNKLADLIDPTCRVVPFDEESMRLPHCSRCGQPMLKPWPNFCPNCGARVTSGGE